MNTIKALPIGRPTILNNEFVLFIMDLQNSFVFDNENGIIAKANNHKQTITIHNGIDDEKIDSLLNVLKTTLKGSSYDIGTYQRAYIDLNKFEEYVKLKPVNFYGKALN